MPKKNKRDPVRIRSVLAQRIDLFAPLAPNESGFALLSASILLGILLAFSFVVLDNSLNSRRVGKVFQQSLSSEQIAEAGVNKAMYCLTATSGTNCGGTYGTSYAGESNVSFGGGTFTTTVTGSGLTRTVSASGQGGSGKAVTVITDITSVPPTDSTHFSYALQSGAGGAKMENNSSITGTMYSNGDIVCTNTNATITGEAYSSLSGGKVDKCTIKSDAHADKVTNSKAKADAYYKNDPADISGTTVTGTKHANSATPAAAPMPSMDTTFWHDSATAGGVIIGDYSPANNSNLGPVEITGNLNLSNNVTVTVKGPVWVHGNITTGNNDTFSLDPSFGSYSTVILADDPSDNVNHGVITISNNTTINGSGDPKSHILFASTNNSVNDASPALSVANNAAGAVFFAMNGVLSLSNNAGAKSLAGYRLYLNTNAVVTYSASDFSGQFANSPGGTWHVSTGSWREIH